MPRAIASASSTSSRTRSTRSMPSIRSPARRLRSWRRRHVSRTWSASSRKRDLRRPRSGTTRASPMPWATSPGPWRRPHRSMSAPASWRPARAGWRPNSASWPATSAATAKASSRIPRRLQEVRERLAALKALQRKYGETDDDVLAFLSGAEERLGALTGADDRIAELATRERELEAKAAARAAAISEGRAAAAPGLARAIGDELEELGMPGARVEVALEPLHGTRWVGRGAGRAPLLRRPRPTAAAPRQDRFGGRAVQDDAGVSQRPRGPR